MARLAHGAQITLEGFRAAQQALAELSLDIPLAFAVAPAVNVQDFDFLFPELQQDPANLLEESPATRDHLIQLGSTMRDSSGGDGEGDSFIPAAYTYFGQFVDHDITLETASATLDQLFAPDLAPLTVDEVRSRLRNLRTATLDLDSVYGMPAPRDPQNSAKMLVGPVTPLNGAQKPLLRPHRKGDNNDLPREGRSVDIEHDRAARIGDPRNDENTIIAQLHVAFLHAHNALVESGYAFEEAQRLLRQHYQHIVVHDFLTRIADPEIVADILQDGARIYDALAEPFFMPLEFSVAAYRFGHTMVRADYDFNLNFNRSGEPGTTPATLQLLFVFTALSGQLGLAPQETDTLPDNWIVEWENFVDLGKPFNRARLIDPQLVEPLFELRTVTGEVEPGNHARLAVRNLLRGYLLRMPTGQAVVKAVANKLAGVRDIPVLSPDQIIACARSEQQIAALQAGGFLERTPLWYYILAEACALGAGQRLGPVGSIIVGETLIGLVRRSEDSILRYPGWKPSLHSATPGTFTLTDLLALAGAFAPAPRGNVGKQEVAISVEPVGQ